MALSTQITKARVQLADDCVMIEQLEDHVKELENELCDDRSALAMSDNALQVVLMAVQSQTLSAQQFSKWQFGSMAVYSSIHGRKIIIYNELYAIYEECCKPTKSQKFHYSDCPLQ